ncbi:unnamed protein product [Didymodactylos carnosus]|uniref:Uncharacterized protein n=1 Tax=Didymodactylos carnosus TaxID=1234261 RepID=A0A815AJU7_9BILA|nr:unnamed protein product [Didymodactylos carnosus]CAF1257706.1 unnamed protein product [Didymodactylos carnosus]CAF3560452.1 unnamed protein product [Didymodactylos carnosus]CAF4032293.1 unnamed protein product [Didymodactylos carnosus]
MQDDTPENDVAVPARRWRPGNAECPIYLQNVIDKLLFELCGSVNNGWNSIINDIVSDNTDLDYALLMGLQNIISSIEYPAYLNGSELDGKWKFVKEDLYRILSILSNNGTSALKFGDIKNYIPCFL